MLIIILTIVISLVVWSLHLMQEATNRREFSLMLAGTLVAFAAAAVLSAYLLMGNYIGYVTAMTQRSAYQASLPEIQLQVSELEHLIEIQFASEYAASSPVIRPDAIASQR